LSQELASNSRDTDSLRPTLSCHRTYLHFFVPFDCCISREYHYVAFSCYLQAKEKGKEERVVPVIKLGFLKPRRFLITAHAFLVDFSRGSPI
jgi:hypothetical protein